MAEARSENHETNSLQVNNNDDGDRKKNDENDEEIEDSKVHWISSHPECPVCLQACLQPVILPCGHIFCFLCVKGFAYRSRRCALCRGEVTLEYFQTPVVVKVKETDKSGTSENDSKSDWFYEGHNGWWQYDVRASSVLEQAYAAKERSCELTIAGFVYLVDFCNMIQFRKSNPARCRRIKRDQACAERKGIAGLKTVKNTDPIKPNIENNSNTTDQTKNDTATVDNANDSSKVDKTDAKSDTSATNEKSDNVEELRDLEQRFDRLSSTDI